MKTASLTSFFKRDLEGCSLRFYNERTAIWEEKVVDEDLPQHPRSSVWVRVIGPTGAEIRTFALADGLIDNPAAAVKQISREIRALTLSS